MVKSIYNMGKFCVNACTICILHEHGRLPTCRMNISFLWTVTIETYTYTKLFFFLIIRWVNILFFSIIDYLFVFEAWLAYVFVVPVLRYGLFVLYMCVKVFDQLHIDTFIWFKRFFMARIYIQDIYLRYLCLYLWITIFW